MKNLLLILVLLLILSCNNKGINKKDIIGKWKAFDSNIIPFTHPSSCKKLDLNTVLQFDLNGVPKLFPSSKDTNCILYQNYFIKDSLLVFNELDMQFSYDILKLSKDTLIIRSSKIPYYFFETESKKQKQILETIKKEGIIISFKK